MNNIGIIFIHRVDISLSYYIIYKNIFTVLHGSVAEWSKALDLGSSLSGGVGSNPTAVSNF